MTFDVSTNDVIVTIDFPSNSGYVQAFVGWTGLTWNDSFATFDNNIWSNNGSASRLTSKQHFNPIFQFSAFRTYGVIKNDTHMTSGNFTVSYGSDKVLQNKLNDISSKLESINFAIAELNSNNSTHLVRIWQRLNFLNDTCTNIDEKLDRIIELLEGEGITPEPTPKPSDDDKSTVSNYESTEKEIFNKTDNTEIVNSQQEGLMSFIKAAPSTIYFASNIFNKLVNGKITILVYAAIIIAVFPVLIGVASNLGSSERHSDMRGNRGSGKGGKGK